MFQKRNNYIKLFRYFIISFVFYSCKQNTKNDVNLLISNIDSIRVGEELIVKIYLDNSKASIIKAYFDCEINLDIDENNKTISGCVKELHVDNDTIFIGFRPSIIGTKNFAPIMVLVENEFKELKILNTSFSYNVKD